MNNNKPLSNSEFQRKELFNRWKKIPKDIPESEKYKELTKIFADLKKKQK